MYLDFKRKYEEKVFSSTRFPKFGQHQNLCLQSLSSLCRNNYSLPINISEIPFYPFFFFTIITKHNDTPVHSPTSKIGKIQLTYTNQNLIC